jgi:hypothetical protein
MIIISPIMTTCISPRQRGEEGRVRANPEEKSLLISLCKREKSFYSTSKKGSLRGATPLLKKLYSLSLEGEGQGEGEPDREFDNTYII